MSQKKPLSPAQLAQRRAANKRWHEIYSGSEQHKEWASQGYWALGEKYGFKTANKIAFGRHLTKGQYKKEKAEK